MTDTASFAMPQDRHYDPGTHLWVRMEDVTGELLVGIDSMGLAALGDLAFLTVKEPGARLMRGEAVGSLEAAKMIGDLTAPASGVLRRCNPAVLADPGLVNRDPYGEGWIFSLEPSDWKTESALLISGPSIAGWVETEVQRYQSQGLA